MAKRKYHAVVYFSKAGFKNLPTRAVFDTRAEAESWVNTTLSSYRKEKGVYLDDCSTPSITEK